MCAVLVAVVVGVSGGWRSERVVVLRCMRDVSVVPPGHVVLTGHTARLLLGRLLLLLE